MAANVQVGDSESVRLVDRIRVMTYREIRDMGVDWLTQSWVAKHVKRHINFVKQHWSGNPYDAAMNTELIGLGGRTLSDESRRLVVSSFTASSFTVRYAFVASG